MDFLDYLLPSVSIVLLTGPLDCIQCLLVHQPWRVYVKKSIGERLK